MDLLNYVPALVARSTDDRRVMFGQLTAGCHASHAGLAKAFLKAGFSLEATLPSRLIFEGRRVDKQVFGLLANRGSD